MSQYAPLPPVEPPISAGPFHKKSPVQHFRGFESLPPLRTSVAAPARSALDVSKRDKHAQLPVARSWTSSTGSSLHSHNSVPTDHRGSPGDFQPSTTAQQHLYSESIPHGLPHPNLSPHSGDRKLETQPHYGHHQHSIPISYSTASVHHALPSNQPPYYWSATSAQQQSRRLDSIPPAPAYESSPASTAGSRSLPSSHHTWSSRTSPPISAHFANAPDFQASDFQAPNYQALDYQASVSQVSVSRPSTSCAAIRTSHAPPFTYTLIIRQQPLAARACGQGERDRRTIDPPPILELRIHDRKTGAPVEDASALLALSCTLLRSGWNGDESASTTPTVDRAPARKLMGSTVASPYQGKDEHGRAGTFFVLADLSCRDPGRHKLRFSLVRLDPMMMQQGTQHPNVATIDSEVFMVYVAKDFPGMRASSRLLVALRAQGLNVPLKKGKDSRGRAGVMVDGEEETEDEISLDEGMESESDDAQGSRDVVTRGRTTTRTKKTKTKKKKKRKGGKG